LISQVAGRAGRTSAEGVVVVQTYSPHNPAIVLAARHDYPGFAVRELELRARAELPPAWRMARVVCRDTDAEKARGRAERLARELGLAAESGVRVTGPSVCAMERIHDHWRFAVEVTAPRAGQVQRCLQAVRAAGLLTSDLHTAVDVDPVALL
jgi:primosomal protein N' (replication factor Y)